jgi:hypothetical protein
MAAPSAAELAQIASLAAQVLALFKRYPDILFAATDVLRFFPDSDLTSITRAIAQLYQSKKIMQPRIGFYKLTPRT